MEQPNGGAADRPYNVIGYREQVDEQGDVTLWARRSPLDIQAVAVVVSVIVLKKLAALYCAIEADQQLAAMGLKVYVSETGAAREVIAPFNLGGS